MQPDASRPKSVLLVWWIVWGSIFTGLVILWLVFGLNRPLPKEGSAAALANLVGLVPLFVSIVIRWLVLPRYDDILRAFPVFIIGLALAEGCGILGLFLGGAYRDDLVVLGLLGIGQFVPLFAGRLNGPKPQGYVPNN